MAAGMVFVEVLLKSGGAGGCIVIIVTSRFLGFGSR